MAALRLVVIGDSFAFTDDRGPQLPGTAHLFPNVVARQLEEGTGRGVHPTVIARAGSNLREVWRTLTKDQHVIFDVLAGADAVVVAVGSYDLLPAGLPSWVTAAIAHVGSPSLRRPLRAAARRSNPTLVRLTGGRRPITPLAEFDRLLDLVLSQVRGVTHGAAGVLLGPVGHSARQYAGLNPHLDTGRVRMAHAAQAHGFAFVDPAPFLAGVHDALNPDGIHWPAEAHDVIGRSLATPLVAQLRGQAPRPPSPWVGSG